MDNIILIGFMGSGKSSVGRYMEQEQGYKLIDTDEYIEKQQGDTISNIFANQGEEYFRRLETECIRELIDAGTMSSVISVGGGLPVKVENREFLKKLGKVVYLRATVDTLVNRLSGDSTRPLIQGGDLRTKITDLFRKRESIYEDVADIVIDTDDCSLEKIFGMIKEALDENISD